MTKANYSSTGLLVNRAGKVRLGVINDAVSMMRLHLSPGGSKDIDLQNIREVARSLVVEQDNLARPLTQEEWRLVATCVC